MIQESLARYIQPLGAPERPGLLASDARKQMLLVPNTVRWARLSFSLPQKKNPGLQAACRRSHRSPDGGLKPAGSPPDELLPGGPMPFWERLRDKLSRSLRTTLLFSTNRSCFRDNLSPEIWSAGRAEARGPLWGRLKSAQQGGVAATKRIFTTETQRRGGKQSQNRRAQRSQRPRRRDLPGDQRLSGFGSRESSWLA